MHTNKEPHLLAGLLSRASRALGFTEHIAIGATMPHAHSPAWPGAAGHLRLQELLPAAPIGKQQEYPTAIKAKYAGQQITLSAALVEASLVCAAGARIIPISHAPVAATDGRTVLYEQAGTFSIITPAIFTALADGGNAQASAFPAARTNINIGDAPTHTIRFEFSRRDQKMVKEEVLTFETMLAITQGIARTADSVLLNAIAATNPSAFTIGKAAAKGLKFDGVRAIIGTSGQGATVGADGKLRAGGIQAELTDVVPGTFAGAFSRSAVAIHEEITLLVERLDVNGSMAVTAHVNMQPLLPDPGAFWTVA